jgi:hypothetical protein
MRLFSKYTTFSLSKDDVEILDGELIKTASIKLPDGIAYDPEFFYMRVRGVSAGEYYGCNKNADYFPEDELVKGHPTFMQAHAFKNHENKDVANAIGDVLAAHWDNKMKSVILLLRIDRRLAPTVVRGFEKGYMTDVSMGCRIDYSLCSICGNKAKIRSEYCDHINNMKHKIFADGRKVYEINIGPKFHDISAVLNGAEKVAKVTGMLITGNKIAFDMQRSLEKVASIEESINKENLEMNVKAASEIIEDNLEILEKTASAKKSNLQKIAEIKKEIQCKIEDIAKGEVISDKFNHADKLSQLLKLVGTRFWDRETCDEISAGIRSIATEKLIPVPVAFSQFLRVLDFAGIELSPLEFKEIADNLMGDAHDADVRDYDMGTPDDLDSEEESVFNNDIGDSINLPTMFNAVRGLRRIPLEDKILSGNPMSKLKAIIIRVQKPMVASSESLGSFMNMIKGFMPERSNHRRFLIKRIVNLPKEANYSHFAITKVASDENVNADNINSALTMLLYAKYQGDRVRRFNDGDLDFGLNKFASVIEGEKFDNILEDAIEKEAFTGKGYTTRKALLYGMPLTFGYSALQRSRIKNNENVSGFNRYVAENPANAYVVQALAGPHAVKALKRLPKKVARKAEELSDKTYMKHADMFRDSQIDEEAKKIYNESQLVALKKACLLIEDERQDLSEHVLGMNKLAESDTDRYLQICKDYFKIEFEKELEKTSGVIKEMALGALGNTVFNKKGTSLLASMPAAVIDGAAITLLAKHLSEPKVKSPKPKEK